MKCPAPSTTSTQAPGIRSAASVDAASGIGLRDPWTNPTWTSIRGSRASSAGSSAMIDGTISAESALAIRSAGIGGARSGSAK
jgi:hypothetical protein